MSDRSWRQRFLDIIEATVQIGVYISNISESEFYQDARTFDAVVRNIILIGDAASGIPPEVRSDLPDIPWQRIVGIRNILTHKYYAVDDKTVWEVASRHAPSLSSQLESYLTSPQSP